MYTSPKVDQGEDLAAAAQHLALLGQPVEDSTLDAGFEGHVVDPRLDLRRLGLGRFDRPLGRVKPCPLAVERRAASLGQSLLDVVILARRGLAGEEAALSFELDLGQLELAVSLDDVGLDLEGLGLLLGDSRLGSRQLRLECDGIHLGHDLTGMDHVPLVDEDRLHPARLLGRHVHLDRFNPPIARGKPGRQRVQSGLVELPAEDPAPGEECERDDPERSPLHRARSQGFVELTTLVDVISRNPIHYPAPIRGQQGPGRF